MVRKSKALYDLIVLAVLGVVAFGAASKFDFFGMTAAWAAERKDWPLDELPALVLILTTALCIFAVRRWREYGHELRSLRILQEEIGADEERCSQLSENSLTGIFILQDGVGIYANQRLGDILGYPIEEIIGRSYLEMVHPADRCTASDRVAVCLNGDLSLDPNELRLVKKTGAEIWCEILATLIQYRGRPAVMGNVVEITERKKTEEALRTSEAQLANAVEMAHLGHWELDVLKNEFTFNDQFYKLFRTTVEQVGGYTMSLDDYARRFVHPDETSVVSEENRKAIEADDPYFSRELEHRIVYADGETGHISVRFFIVKDDLGRTVRTYGVNQDITQRKRLEQMELQSGRLQALADLAGGVAHNFNNLLQVVIGNLELTLMYLESGNYFNARDTLEKVLERSRSGAETVQRLQSFAGIRDRSRLSEKGVFDLSGVVRQALEMSTAWWKTIPEKQGIEVSLDADLQEGCLVRCEKNELTEMAVNLIRNATDALPRGGTIKAKTYVQGDQVVFEIRDTGIGISEENLKRLFNPFFTTKASPGSGLGLATSRKIIEDYGGNILVESAEGQGTTFTILLPAASRLGEEPEPGKEAPCPGMTILVIDDMEAVLDVMKAGLARSGHTVVTADSGRRGLEIFEKNPLDLVICDLGMRGMNGWEVGKRIRASCEERHIAKPRFILLTGWAGQENEREKMTECGVDAVAVKPIDTGKILTLIGEICDRKPPIPPQ
ncbi:MAG: PAS domain S-box protein [Pseudomonadota bacterium]